MHFNKVKLNTGYTGAGLQKWKMSSIVREPEGGGLLTSLSTGLMISFRYTTLIPTEVNLIPDWLEASTACIYMYLAWFSIVIKD